VPSALLSTSTGTRGLRAQYFASLNFTGDPIVEQDELLVEINRILFDSPALSTSSPKRSPVPWQTGPKFSVRWTGVIEFPADGEYTLALCALGASRLWLDDALVIDASSQSSAPTAAASGSSMPILGGASQNPQDLEIPRKPFTGARIVRHTLHARVGERRAVRIEYAADHPAINFLNGAQFRFGMIAPAGVVMPLAKEAAALAATCDVAIVVARTQELEGMDRAHLRLPGGQEELIRAVCAANPRTIVVTMSGGPLDVSNWNAAAPAILSAWFAGQEQGAAVARVLFGDVAPRGRLPLTFPRGERTPLLTLEQYPGVDGTIHYTEYADLQVTDDAATFTLKNTGARAGCETAQAYLTPPVETGEPIKLAGFVQVELQPGEARRVTIPFDARARSMWNAARAEWERIGGDWQVHVGASAGDVRLRA
jgi:beta-glucosidase